MPSARLLKASDAPDIAAQIVARIANREAAASSRLINRQLAWFGAAIL